jgi:hypothetical protein
LFAKTEADHRHEKKPRDKALPKCMYALYACMREVGAGVSEGLNPTYGT